MNVLNEAEALLAHRRAQRESRSLFFLSGRTGRIQRIGAGDDGAVRSTDLNSPEMQEWLKTLTGKSSLSGLTAQTAYQQVAPVFQAIEIRTGALAGVPYTLETDRGDVIFDSDPALQQDFPEALAFLDHLPVLLDLAEAALSLSGKVRIHKERASSRGTVDNLRWYNPTTISVAPEDYEVADGRATGRVLRYTKTPAGGGEPFKIDAEDMLAVDRPDPFVECGPGTPPYRPAREGAEVLDALATFLSGHLSTGMVKNLFFTLKDPSGGMKMPGAVALQTFKSGIFNWIKQRGRVESAEDVKVLSQATEVHEVGEGIRELSDKDLSLDYWRWIGSAFNIPFGLMVEKAANYATLQLQLYQLYQVAIFKDCRLLQRALNAQLFRDLKLRFQWQYHRVEAVQWAEIQKAQSAALLAGGAPVLTPQEIKDLFQLWPETTGADLPAGDGAAADEVARHVVTATR